MKVSTGLVALCFALASLVSRGGTAADPDDDPPPGAAAPEPPRPARPAPAPAAPAPAAQAAPAAQTSAAQASPGGAQPAQAPAGQAAPGAQATPGAQGAVPPTAAPVVVPPAPPLDGATYAVRLRDLEAKVDDLKEQIRRSHTRLSLLSDTILSGGAGGARASILFQNDMSGAFRLTRALFVLDGVVQYNKQDDSGVLSGQKQIPIFKGAIAPGDHTLQVLLRLRGHGYGVFSYLRGYQFEVKQSHSFSVTEGKEMAVDVIAWEKGGVTTPLEQRPAVRYLEHLRDLPAPTGGGSEGTPAPAGGERE